MSPFTSLIVFAILCASAFADNVSSGYIVRVDYTDSGCTTAFRNTTFLINVCAPPAPVMYQYDSSSGTVSQSYFSGDQSCTPSAAMTGTFQEGQCIPSPIAPYTFFYSETFPALEDGVYTYTVFNPAKSDCSGEVYSVKQELGLCYVNYDQGYNSTQLTCAGSTLSTLRCTDNDCQTACDTVTTSADASKCDTPNHAISSCNAPQTTSGGATVATTGKTSTTGSATLGKTTASGTTTGSGTGSGSGSGSTTKDTTVGNADSTGSSSAATVVASVVLASVSFLLLL